MGIGKVAAVFVDRDGVINRAIVRDGKPYPPASVAEMEVMPDAFTALPLLKRKGFQLIVVTNQPDVARGAQSREQVEAMHAALQAQLPIDHFYVCYHDDADHCDCRKPAPGLLMRAASEHGLSLADSFLIGDRWRDIEAGQAAGVRTIWLDYSYRERGPQRPPDARVTSLEDAAKWIVNRSSEK